MEDLMIESIGSLKKTEYEFNRQRRDIRSEIHGAFKSDPFQIELSSEVSRGDLIKAVENVNEKIKVDNKKLECSYHERTKSFVVKVVDTATNEIIREVPPEKMLDMIADVWDRLGLFLDEKV